MVDREWELAVRHAAIAYVAELTNGGFTDIGWHDLKRFQFNGERVHLIGPQGIFKPALLELPISITTAPPRIGQAAPYDDAVSEDGRLFYSYRGTDPHHRDNVGLRVVLQYGLPLLYFLGIAKGRYHAEKAWIVADHPAQLTVEAHLESTDSIVAGINRLGGEENRPAREYAYRIVRQRRHQANFRVSVLAAYRERCSICRIRHRPLLDAAHILADSEGGVPEVRNGLSLCKIHHSAFDARIVGLRPERGAGDTVDTVTTEIRNDVLTEIDGPMLQHGLQELHGTPLTLPRNPDQRPSRDAVEARYEAFLETSA